MRASDGERRFLISHYFWPRILKYGSSVLACLISSCKNCVIKQAANLLLLRYIVHFMLHIWCGMGICTKLLFSLPVLKPVFRARFLMGLSLRQSTIRRVWVSGTAHLQILLGIETAQR